MEYRRAEHALLSSIGKENVVNEKRRAYRPYDFARGTTAAVTINCQLSSLIIVSLTVRLIAVRFGIWLRLSNGAFASRRIWTGRPQSERDLSI